MLVRRGVAIISALFSLILRQLGSLVRAVLGWSVTALFGRLPTMQQTALAAMLLASLVWPVLVVGIFVPSVAAWGFAFVPLEKWWGIVPVRILSVALSALVPPVVGLVTFRLAPRTKAGSRWWHALLAGYPLTVGYALSCLLTAFVVPLVKVASILRGWEDEHAYVQPREGKYDATLEEVLHACRDAGVAATVEDVPARLSASTSVLKWLARGIVDPMVPEHPKMLRAKDLEVYLYPADLLLRGEKGRVARLRACITRTMLERFAYLAADPGAHRVQDELGRMWDMLERHERPEEIGRLGRQRLAEIEQELDTTSIPFDDWLILDRGIRRLELALGGGTRLALPESETRANDDEHRHAAARESTADGRERGSPRRRRRARPGAPPG